MVSRIRESENYRWSLDDYVRKEATGTVYKGLHKTKERRHCIKVLNLENQRLAEREFEILKKISHRNVVKCWATEKDVCSNEYVMIMECCDGGSLLSLLEQPENMHGITERDFLCLLHDIASGMKHLRDRDIVHRNINPENIQYQVEDGWLVFKLNDFGTARLLGNGLFESFYGKPEYQCPEVFERAVLKQGSTKPFSTAVDLWSMGITLYQAATGCLPFQPCRGPQKNANMYQMMSRKPSGCISAIQRSHDGQIEWSQTLPETCNLSLGLQNFICPLLADMLESKPDQIMISEAFFDQVTVISRKLAILVFNLCDFNLLHIYCDPDISLSEFHNLISQQTDIPVMRRHLFYDYHPLTDPTKVSSFPPTSPSSPIFLFPADQQPSAVKNLSPKLPKCPELVMQVSLSEDPSLAKQFLVELRYLRRLAADLHLKQQLVEKAAKILHFVLFQDVLEVKDLMDRFASLVMTEIGHRMSLMCQSQHLLWQILNPLREQPLEVERKLDQHRQSAIQIGNEVEEMFDESRRLCEEINTNIFVSSNWATKSSCQDDQNNCLKRIDTLISDTDEIKNVFSEKIHLQQLDENQTQIHLFEKGQLQEIFAKGLKWVNGNCLKNSEHIYKQAMDWYSQCQNVSREMEELKVRVNSAAETLKLLTRNVDEFEAEMNVEWEKLFHEANIQLLPQPSLLLMYQHQQEVSRHKVSGGEFVFGVRKNLFRKLNKIGVIPVVLQETSGATDNSHPERMKSPTLRFDDSTETSAVYTTLEEQTTLTE